MSSKQSAKIPPFYRLWMTWVDPLIGIPTIAMAFIAPEALVNSAIPKSVSPFDPYQIPVIFMIGGLFSCLTIVTGVLLRNTNDVRLWKIVQGAILSTDISILFALFYGLRQQDRMDTSLWRADDWFNLGLTAFVAVLRLAFIAEIGFQADPNGVKKKL